jgi:hypothetical protein
VLLWLVILFSITIASIVMEDNITNHNNTNHSFRISIVMEDNITNHNNTNHSFRTSIVMEDNSCGWLYCPPLLWRFYRSGLCCCGWLYCPPLLLRFYRSGLKNGRVVTIGKHSRLSRQIWYRHPNSEAGNDEIQNVNMDCFYVSTATFFFAPL